MSFLKDIDLGKSAKQLNPTITKVTKRDLATGKFIAVKEQLDAINGKFVERDSVEVKAPTHLEEAEVVDMDGMQKYPPIISKARRYNPTKKRWQAQDEKTYSNALQEQQQAVKQLTLVTFNVWFAKLEWQKRAAGLLKIIQESKADIVCLQEVTPRLLDVLKMSPNLQLNYVFSDVIGTSVTPYGVLMLIHKRHPVFQFALHHFPTCMGRKLLTADIVIGSSTSNNQHDRQMLRLGTVHFESLNNTKVRLAQMDLSFQHYLKSESCALLCGDFNFDPRNPEEQKLPETYVDVWKQLHPCTVTTSENTTCGASLRIDRIMVKSQSLTCSIKATTIKRLGMEPLGIEKNPTLCVSDHKGLQTTLVITEK